MRNIIESIYLFGNSAIPGHYIFVEKETMIGCLKNGNEDKDFIFVIAIKDEYGFDNQYRILGFGKNIIEMFLDTILFLKNELIYSVRPDDLSYGISDQISLKKVYQILTKKETNFPFRNEIPHEWDKDKEFRGYLNVLLKEDGICALLE